MRDIFIFAAGASIVGTVFLVSLTELLFTIKRRRRHAELEDKIKELRNTYNESVNKLVIESDTKIEATEKQAEEKTSEAVGEKEQTSKEYEEKMAALQAKTEKEVEAAHARAKKMQQEAKLKAEEYLATRKKEVENDLMDLVLSVTKKVLPESLTYEVQKELVLDALRDVKSEGPVKK